MSNSRLIRLVYASTATFQPRWNATGVEPHVARILMQSRRNNARAQVGGVLHFGDGYFFQCLEGEREQVNKIYRRIGDDERHRDVELLTLHDIDQRLFSDWSMKYVAIEKEVEKILRQFKLKQFNPYEFDAPLVAALLDACVQGADDSTGEIPDQGLQAKRHSGRTGFLKRLFNR